MARGPIVGRDLELEQLDEALADVHDRRGGVTLLVGEPGIGKSRLCEEVARRAAGAAIDVVWGRAWEAGGAPPYWPWTQALRAIGGDATSVHVARLRGDADVPAHTGSEDRFLVFDAVTRYLVASSPRPRLIIFEDLHAADESSLHLLAFVATQLANAPVLILGTYRDVEARLTASAGAVLDHIARSARVIHPRRLGADDVIALAASLPALALEPDALAAIHRRSEGNPLFVVELLRVLARTGAHGAVPASVRTAIREHLRGVPAPVARILEAAAVIGREFATPVLADVSSLSAAEVDDALASALELGVLVERGPARFAFMHGLIAETLHDDLPAQRRTELHLAVANALERDPVKPLAEIAHHLLDAGRDNAERAADVALQAAERARRQLAFEPAVELIERVFAKAPPTNARTRFELLRLLAEVRILSGGDARGKEAAREACDLARTLASPELLARGALTYGQAYYVGATDHVLVQLLEEADAALPPDALALRARLKARLAAALTPSRDMTSPMQIARDAIAMARRLRDDERTRLEVIYAAMSALNLFAPPRERVALSREVLALAEKLDEPLLALRTHQRLLFDHYELGDLNGVDAHHHAYDELAERVHLPRAKWSSATFRGMRALLHGDFAAHDAAFAEAAELAEAAGDRFFGEVGVVSHCLPLGRLKGDDEALRREHARMQRVFSANGTPYLEISAIVHLRLGELDEVRRVLARCPGLAVEVKNHRIPVLACYMAEVAFDLGDREIAETLYDGLAADDSPCAMLHMHGFAVERPSAHGAMQFAATLGDFAGARRHYERALALIRSLDARPLEAWLQLDFARVLIAEGPAHADEAARLLVAARTIANALGMTIEHRIARAEQQLARPGRAPTAPPPAAPPSAEALVSLQCEGDYWLVEGCGVSCRVKGTKGVELLARLVAEPNREIHVLDLVGAEGVDAGDAGEVIDGAARDAYRKRLLELREDLEEAESWNDAARAERLRTELEALESELSRAAGLGGRERRVGRAAERARINVQRRLADALRRIGDADAELGRHLTASIRTGVYCSYAPERAVRAR